MAMEQGLYSQAVMLRQNYLKITEEKKLKIKINSRSRVSLQDHSVGSILVFIVLKNILAHVNLIYINKYFKGMMKQKIQIHFKCLQF